MWKKIFGGKNKGESSLDSLLSAPQITQIDKERLPQHVAMIMDGNGRWAQGKGMIRTAGHTAGVKTLKRILKTASDIGVKVLTVYAFSTENWKRPHEEVDFLMQLFSEYLEKELHEMNKDNVRIHFLGRREVFSARLQKQIQEAENLMENNTGIHFNVAANYGGQDELLRVMRTFAGKAAAGELHEEDITESLVEAFLDTAGDPPVDLIIRTSGDMRLSNFLLWQAAYAEFWFTETNWPDFTPEEFVEALEAFAQRDRRFGGIKKK